MGNLYCRVVTPADRQKKQFMQNNISQYYQEP
nr:MAG TPA: hypothetical protein [Caudoviricetes sp.]